MLHKENIILKNPNQNVRKTIYLYRKYTTFILITQVSY
jgi:hypothetical protein